ncbi:MAG: 50S ribosomal protein L13 [Pyrobaculum sp.]
MKVVKKTLDISSVPESGEIIVDAEGHVAGRLASYIAKLLIEKPRLRVIVVNIDKAVVTGERKMAIEWYKRKISEWRTHYNPEKVGPKVPRRPDRVFKRIVRGMLPKKTERGREALKRLRVYMSMPLELYNRKALVMYQIPKAMLKIRPLIKYITLEEIWKSVDQTAWEKWTKAKALWEKKIKTNV